MPLRSGRDLHSSGENQPTCIVNHQLFAKENHILRVALQPVDFSDSELAMAYYAGVEVV
jgi:hypothetical protein